MVPLRKLLPYSRGTCVLLSTASAWRILDLEVAVPPMSSARPGQVPSQGPTQGRDRRAFPRYQFRIDVEIEWGSKALWGQVTDISQQGMFIEIPDLDWVNASFTANLALGIPLRVECVVCRIVPNRGVGVTIVVPDEEKRRFHGLLWALGQELAQSTLAAAGLQEIPKQQIVFPSGPNSR